MSGFSINHVVISGNLTRDPELRSIPSGTSVCEIGVAVNESVKNSHGGFDERPNFFDVTIWGGLGEWVARNVSKGDGIAVAGRLRWESWEKEGQKRSKVKIIADSIMPRTGSVGGNGGAAASDIPADTGGFGVPSSSAADDDIPF